MSRIAIVSALDEVPGALAVEKEGAAVAQVCHDFARASIPPGQCAS